MSFLAQMTYVYRMYIDHSYVNNFENSFPVKMTFFKIAHITVIYKRYSVRNVNNSMSPIYVILGQKSQRLTQLLINN